jgi:hypothetical protein
MSSANDPEKDTDPNDQQHQRPQIDEAVNPCGSHPLPNEEVQRRAGLGGELAGIEQQSRLSC